MKTFLNNYAWAALAITAASFSACSSDSNLIDIAEPINKHTVSDLKSGKYTMTIKAAKTQDGATTRALSLEGKTLNATWKEGETVDVYAILEDGDLGAWLGQLTAAASDNGTTTLTGTIDLDEVTKVRLFYPNYNRDYTGQDGTLEKIATNYDYAEASITSGLNVDTENHTISASGTVSFESQQAIVKFTLLDKESNSPINATSLTVADDDGKLLKVKDLLDSEYFNEYGPINATLSEPSSEVFVALSPVSSRITLTARDGSNFYTYSTTQDITFEEGKYYSITVKMDKSDAIDISTLTSDYEAQDGDVLTGTLTPDNYHISIADGATVTLLNASILNYTEDTYGDGPAGITCLGNANLILKGSNIVNAGSTLYPNIYVKENYTLTIDGEGSLTVGENDSPGIGGGYGRRAGNVNIDGGHITVANGIGAGNLSSIENIIINGGELNVNGGIGSGFNGSCKSIFINGGTVIATGKYGGAAIGTGTRGTCEGIYIYGGNITATGDSGGAGIGCGQGGSCDEIAILGGIINAQGANVAAGIGAGASSGEQGSTCGNIYIIGDCNITATGGVNGAGIGSSINLSSCGDIVITRGEITATGGSNASGIGTGNSGQCGNISISADYEETTSITATGGEYAPGIGSAEFAQCGNISIDGGNIEYPGTAIVTATGGEGAAGIGTGNQNSTCGNITITNTVTKITSKKGKYAEFSVGISLASTEAYNSCGTITIGGVVQDGSIRDETFIYQP